MTWWIPLEGIAVLLLWVGGWGISEMIIDKISGNRDRLRFYCYVSLILIGIFLLSIILSNIEST